MTYQIKKRDQIFLGRLNLPSTSILNFIFHSWRFPWLKPIFSEQENLLFFLTKQSDNKSEIEIILKGQSIKISKLINSIISSKYICFEFLFSFFAWLGLLLQHGSWSDHWWWWWKRSLVGVSKSLNLTVYLNKIFF